MIVMNRTGARAHALLASLLTLPASIWNAKPRPYGDDDDEDDGPNKNNLQSLISRAGNAEAAANELWRDNYQLRQQRRDLRKERDDLKAKLPADGTLVLTKEQAAEWEAYQKLGKPTDIEKAVTEGKTAAEQVAKQARADQVAKAAKDVGFNPEVLTQLTELHGLTITSQTIKVGDKDQTAHYITPQGGQPMELTQYATANWGAFMPSLQVQQQQQQQGQPGQQQQQQQGQPGAQPWVNQGGAGGGQPNPTGNTIADLATKLVQQRAGTAAAAPAAGQPGQQGHVPGGPGAPAQ